MTAEFDDRGIVSVCPNCGQKNRLLYERLGETVRCGNCKQEIAAVSAPIEITHTADFDRLVAQSSLPIVVDYWAPWCGPCRMVAPELVKVAQRQAGHILVVKVNTDALPDLGERYRIMSIPTMAVFAGGREVKRTVGARPAPEIEAFIQQATAATATGTQSGRP
jgi:thioredoxin 2